MIEFTNLAGDKVAVNPALVFAIETGTPLTQIISPAGRVVFVSESFVEVQRRFAAWAKID
jgi:uncharacterized protein YlzI (FlbEa/FlbD family)